ncbi:MAG: MGMT family protein [Deltaproteobacteria bacterium]|nr:MGMT family protein [Deltaproteobacteria bacterium]
MTYKYLLHLLNTVDATPFQKSVWLKTYEIPRGTVVSYKTLAKAMGHPKAFRAVANALAKNPFPVLIPCHRVVATNGIGGYSGKGGVRQKRKLLKQEGYPI